MKPQEKLELALLQTELAWENAEANLEMIEEKLKKLSDTPDLVVLPEMFNSGFTMNVHSVAEDARNSPTLDWLREKAKRLDTAFCGSLIIRDKGAFYNRFFWIPSEGQEVFYDKRHLFRMAKENDIFSPGKNNPLIEYKGWKILPRVCYDLRFPVWNRTHDIDLQIYVANWPEPRSAAWDKLLLARAIENQCYVAGVNRIGEDGNQIPYAGHSIAIDPKGEPITREKDKESGWIRARLSFQELADFREKFPVQLDADRFQIL